MASQSILALLKKEFAQPFPAQGLPGEKALQIPKKGRTISNRTRRFERERQKFCVHGIIGARQSGASNEHEYQTQFS